MEYNVGKEQSRICTYENNFLHDDCMSSIKVAYGEMKVSEGALRTVSDMESKKELYRIEYQK